MPNLSRKFRWNPLCILKNMAILIFEVRLVGAMRCDLQHQYLENRWRSRKNIWHFWVLYNHHWYTGKREKSLTVISEIAWFLEKMALKHQKKLSLSILWGWCRFALANHKCEKINPLTTFWIKKPSLDFRNIWQIQCWGMWTFLYNFRLVASLFFYSTYSTIYLKKMISKVLFIEKHCLILMLFLRFLNQMDWSKDNISIHYKYPRKDWKKM